MSAKIGVFICPACEAVVRTERTLEEGITCHQCGHGFGKTAEKVLVKAIPPKATGASVVRDVTRKKVSPVRAVGGPAIAAAQPVLVEPDEDEDFLGESAEIIVMPDGTKKVRRRKRKLKQEKNRALVIFLFGWLGVILAIVLALGMKRSNESEVVSQGDKEAEIENQSRKILQRFLPEVSREFLAFMSYPSNEGREQFILDSAELAVDFRRHYREALFPKATTPLRMADANVVQFTDKEIGIETIWTNDEGERIGALHLWDRDAWRLDWENFAPFSTESWTKFRNRLGKKSGTFRLLVRKKRSPDDSREINIGLAQAPAMGDDIGMDYDKGAAELRVKAGSDLARDFLTYWERSLEGEAQFGSFFSQNLDPPRQMRMTLVLAWETDEEGEERMVLKEIVGVDWYGKRVQGIVEKAGESGKAWKAWKASEEKLTIENNES